MKVHKSTEVKVGSGSVSDIIDALRECGVPEHARPTRVYPDMDLVGVDELLCSSIVTRGYVMTFEWDDEE